MDKPLKTKMLDTTINKLLESIERLTRLNYLEMTSCLRLQLIATYLSQPLPMYHFFSCPAQGTTVKNPMKTGAYSTLFSDFQFLSTAQRTFKYKTTLKRNNRIILKTTLCIGVKYTKVIVA